MKTIQPTQQTETIVKLKAIVDDFCRATFPSSRFEFSYIEIQDDKEIFNITGNRIEFSKFIFDKTKYNQSFVETLIIHELLHNKLQGINKKDTMVNLSDTFGPEYVYRFDVYADVNTYRYIKNSKAQQGEIYHLDDFVRALKYSLIHFSSETIRKPKIQRFWSTILSLFLHLLFPEKLYFVWIKYEKSDTDENETTINVVYADDDGLLVFRSLDVGNIFFKKVINIYSVANTEDEDTFLNLCKEVASTIIANLREDPIFQDVYKNDGFELLRFGKRKIRERELFWKTYMKPKINCEFEATFGYRLIPWYKRRNKHI